MSKEYDDGLPFDQMDLEIVSCILFDIFQDLLEVQDILTDLASKLPEEQEKQLDTILEYVRVAGGALDKAHLDTNDVNFMRFGGKDFKWEPMEKQ